MGISPAAGCAASVILCSSGCGEFGIVNDDNITGLGYNQMEVKGVAEKIVLTNQKGGVGKTTTTSAIVAGLVNKGKKVLSVDLDPQGNLGFSLGIDIEDGHTIYEVLKKECTIREAIRVTEDYGDVLTSNILLSEAELLFGGENRQLVLKQILSEVEEDYDYIVIDTPPSLNILTVNGYAAANHLIIPMAAEILSLVGLVQLKETIEAVRSSVNPNLHVLGILLTRYNRRTNLARDVQEMAEAVAAQIGTELFQSKIRTGVAAAEAPAHGMSVFDYSPRSNPSKDYREFVDEVLKKMKEQA